MASRRGASRKRSAANSSRLEPIFFVERSIQSRALVEALRGKGEQVCEHRDYFPPDAPDQEWLAEAGRRGWVVLTKDKWIRRRLLERDALIRANVRAFVLTAGQLRGVEVADIFVRHLRRMKALVADKRPPFIATVTRAEVKILLSRRDLGSGG